MSKNKKNPSVSKTDSKNKNNDDGTKTRKTINVSIQKKNSTKLNTIFNNWDSESLNLSNEVCKCILFKNELENNPITQPLISTLNLIKLTLRNKNLSGKDYDKAFLIALKNIISININTQELCNLVEDDLYFSNNIKPNDSSNTNTTNNITKLESSNTITTNDNKPLEGINTETPEKIIEAIKPIKHTVDTTSTENTSDTLAITQEKNIQNETLDDNKNTTIDINEIIKWDNIPKNPTINNKKQGNKTTDIELLNKRLSAFSYSVN